MKQPRQGSRLLRRLRRRTARVRVRVQARRRAAATATARWRSGRWLGTAGKSPWLRRGALLAALLAVAFVPYPAQSVPALVASNGCRTGCHTAEVNMLRWSAQLTGDWDLDSGLAGTVPAQGTAYAAVGNGVAVLGAGMTVYAYQASNGTSLWQALLSGFAPDAAIVSVRSWPGEVTVGVAYPGRSGVSKRTEVVIPDSTGVPDSEYPAAPFGGAVAATSSYTVIMGPQNVTSYDSATGKVRWQRPVDDAAQGWYSDGQYLYLAESADGDETGAPVTALRRIDTATGATQQILPQPYGGSIITPTFDGTLSAAFDGDVLFSGSAGVTAYSGATGIELWSVPGAALAGTDPEQKRIYLTRGTTLLETSPVTGHVVATAPDLGGGMYVVRDGFALGIDNLGVNGAAWGYDIPAARVALSASNLGWPHYFTDLSGVGGSADPDGSLVVIAACAQAGRPVTTSPSPQGSPGLSGSPPVSASPGASTSPAASTSASGSAPPAPSPPAVQPCLRPELVALGL
ncbi:MAG TPA: PQQ-binding-like beta-propeller repeat protein [Streptosporangiaceae bacterium]